MKLKFLFILAVGFLSNMVMYSQNSLDKKLIENSDTSRLEAKEKLVVIWTSGDREVAKKMVFMYTYNAMKYNWWKDITFIVWGPSSELLSRDEELQDYIKKMLNEGIHVEACKACADMYGIAEKLSKLGIEVRYLGKPLTEYIKEGRNVITF